MSYDIYIEVDTGAGEVAEVAWRNHTSNCSRMWGHALNKTGGCGYDNLGDLIDAVPSARDLAPLVRAAADYMRAHPAEFQPMAPANGWGTYESGLDYLTWLAAMCETHPACTVRVSR